MTAAVASYRYITTDPHFLLESSSAIEVSGNVHVTRDEICDIFGADIGRNVFSISLAERRKSLEELPWVESATVIRLLPNRLRVIVRERNPVAFVQLGTEVELIDANGSLMALPPVAPGAQPLTFPVITGMQAGDPDSQRAARMKIYLQLLQELNAANPSYAGVIDEVDLSDPEDLQLTVSDAGGMLLLHLGSSPEGSNSFQSRFKVYAERIGEWRRQHPHIKAADLRIDGRYYIDPGVPAAADSAAPAGASATEGAAGRTGGKPADAAAPSKIKTAAKSGKPHAAAAASKPAGKQHTEKPRQ